MVFRLARGRSDRLGFFLLFFVYYHIHSIHSTPKPRQYRPVAELVRSGVELGEADDRVFRRVNSKQVSKERKSLMCVCVCTCAYRHDFLRIIGYV